jgi:hypothetical protein
MVYIIELKFEGVQRIRLGLVEAIAASGAPVSLKWQKLISAKPNDLALAA